MEASNRKVWMAEEGTISGGEALRTGRIYYRGLLPKKIFGVKLGEKIRRFSGASI